MVDGKSVTDETGMTTALYNFYSNIGAKLAR